MPGLVFRSGLTVSGGGAMEFSVVSSLPRCQIHHPRTPRPAAMAAQARNSPRCQPTDCIFAARFMSAHTNRKCQRGTSRVAEPTDGGRNPIFDDFGYLFVAS